MSGESAIAQAVALGSYFLSGCLAINVSQLLGTPLYLVNEDWYNTWISFTKQSFNLLTITLTQWWAPTTVRVSGDKTMRGQLFKSVEGNLICNFPERLILIANHQIYTDWLYLWWVAYCAGAAGRIYIILKESLRRIPVIGWGIQLSQFILLKRDWEKDKPHLSEHLQKLNNRDPMWLLLFPEGTNLASCTRTTSLNWAKKNNIPDMQHTLHPRTTGLQFCLQELKRTVGFLYDCTIAYEGVPRGQFAQDIYTLKAQYMEGKPPPKVHMYWRRFRISEIPIDNPKSFESWLRARWIEKDAYIEHYYRTGQMPCDRGITLMSDGTKRKGCGYIETTIKAAAWHDFLQVFAPIGALSMVLYTIYNQLPKDFVDSVNVLAKKAIQDKANSFGQSLGSMQKTFTTYSGGPTVTINSNKINEAQAAALKHKGSEALSKPATTGLKTVTPVKKAPKLAPLPKQISPSTPSTPKAAMSKTPARIAPTKLKAAPAAPASAIKATAEPKPVPKPATKPAIKPISKPISPITVKKLPVKTVPTTTTNAASKPKMATKPPLQAREVPKSQAIASVISTGNNVVTKKK